MTSDVQEIDPSILTTFCSNDSSIKSYIDFDKDPFKKEQLEILPKILLKHAEVFDIVNPESKSSCCFTKSYGKYVIGTGKQ